MENKGFDDTKDVCLVSSMDWSLKPCISNDSCDADKDNLVREDRLASLPDELLIRIFSLLPTKDVAATCFLNTRLSLVFPLITALDFDANPISFCVQQPSAIHRYPIFISFVNTVLRAHRSRYLTRFRLQVGRTCSFFSPYQGLPKCTQECLPDLNCTQLISWISFPLNLCGLRELDLCIMLREPGDAQLPPTIFTCQTLEVLKLEVNLGLDHVFSIPSYHLPNLRFLTLRTTSLFDDSFLPRLLACCPLLEDLTYEVYLFHHVSHITIQSASLRRLSLEFILLEEFGDDNPDIILIHTPALEYLNYSGNLAVCYSIPIMHSLVTAKLDIGDILKYEAFQVTFQQLINLITIVSNVQHLSLSGFIFREFHHHVDWNNPNDQLPMLPNLNYLELGYSSGEYHWRSFLLHLLNCSPVLGILVIEEGVLDGYDDIDFEGEYHKLEREFLGTVHPIPSCCKYHLKRIVIKKFAGIPREVEIVQFFLRHALVLEELIIYLDKEPVDYPIPQQMFVENSLMNLPKASATCSIQVLWSP